MIEIKMDNESDRISLSAEEVNVMSDGIPIKRQQIRKGNKYKGGETLHVIGDGLLGTGEGTENV